MNEVWLGIDASTGDLSLGLWWAGGVARRAERLERRLAGGMVPALEALLADAGVGLAQVRGVAVGDGPGSVTGSRIARAFAAGLARARGVALVGGDSLAARAVAHLPPGGHGEVATVGRKGQAFVAAFARGGEGDPRALGAAVEQPLDALSASAAASLAVPPDAAWLAWCAAHRRASG